METDSESNLEEVLMELNKFEKRLTGENSSGSSSGSSVANPTSSKAIIINAVLENYLASVARTGTTHFPWPKIKPLFRAKLDSVIDEFSAQTGGQVEDEEDVPNVDAFSFAACREKVFQQLDSFGGVPFTVQRLCELMTAPRRHYRRHDKFMRALEKNMLVVSTVDPKAAAQQQPPPPPPPQPQPRSLQRRESAGFSVGSDAATSSGALVNGDHEQVRGEPEKKYAR